MSAALSLTLGAVQRGWHEEVHLHGDAGVLGIVPKDADAAALGELSALVVEVFCHADGLHERPLLARAQQCGREDDRVKGHVVLAHELHQVHILWVLPPRLRTHEPKRHYRWDTACVYPNYQTARNIEGVPDFCVALMLGLVVVLGM